MIEFATALAFVCTEVRGAQMARKIPGSVLSPFSFDTREKGSLLPNGLNQAPFERSTTTGLHSTHHHQSAVTKSGVPLLEKKKLGPLRRPPFCLTHCTGRVFQFLNEIRSKMDFVPDGGEAFRLMLCLEINPW